MEPFNESLQWLAITGAVLMVGYLAKIVRGLSAMVRDDQKEKYERELAESEARELVDAS